MKTSETTDLLDVALSAAQGEMEDAAKDKANPFYKSKYADLASILQIARPALSKHQVSLFQAVEPGMQGDVMGTYVTTRLGHKGQWMESTGFWPCYPTAEKLNGAFTGKLLPVNCQQLGSAGTYGKRYAGSGAIAITQDDDDDANVVSGKVALNSEPGKVDAKFSQVRPDDTTKVPDATKPKKGKPKELSEEDLVELIAKFKAASTPADVSTLVPAFTGLTPEDQKKVLPEAMAARTRAGM